MKFLRSAWAPIAVIVIAIAAALARWLLQGSHNLYTAIAKRFYVPDPDLGWRVSSQHPIWLGLEVIAVLVAMAIGLAGLTWFLKARKPRLAAILAKLGWVGAALAVAVPVAAFASGPGPLDARDTLPPSAAVKLEGGIEGTLSAPAGAYQIVQHEGTAVTAHLSAGHEEFDARFPSVAGQWVGDPGDLAKPMHAQITVTTASIDTGVGERSKHAREAYLHADQFPNIAVELANVTAVRQTAPNEVAFRAPGSVHLLGKTHTVEITGTLQRPDAAALQRLGLTGDVLIVRADFSLPIAETALAPDAHDFDGDRFPIHVSLVLRKTS